MTDQDIQLYRWIIFVSEIRDNLVLRAKAKAARYLSQKFFGSGLKRLCPAEEIDLSSLD